VRDGAARFSETLLPYCRTFSQCQLQRGLREEPALILFISPQLSVFCWNYSYACLPAGRN